MGKINVGRLILGGIVAGIAIDLLDYLVDGVWLAQRWADGMALLGKPGFSQIQIIWFNVLGLLTGTRRHLDLCGDPAPIRRGREDGDHCRRGCVVYRGLPAQRRPHVRCAPVLESPDALHDARRVR